MKLVPVDIFKKQCKKIIEMESINNNKIIRELFEEG